MSHSLNIVCPACDTVNRVPDTRLGDWPVCGRCKQGLLAGRPVELTDHNFATQVGRSDLPVLLDCWADWCGPCKMMAPVFESAAEAWATQVRFAKLNTEVAQASAARLGIRSIPTLILFRGAKEVARQTGALDRSRLDAWLREALSGS
ncbi:MAG: thioredoxin TrxC [Pseudomonadota bacterium]|nr:thioredoxin TrxC [Pseudomonadota bacterium]